MITVLYWLHDRRYSKKLLALGKQIQRGCPFTWTTNVPGLPLEGRTAFLPSKFRQKLKENIYLCWDNVAHGACNIPQTVLPRRTKTFWWINSHPWFMLIWFCTESFLNQSLSGSFHWLGSGVKIILSVLWIKMPKQIIKWKPNHSPPWNPCLLMIQSIW